MKSHDLRVIMATDVVPNSTGDTAARMLRI